MNTSHGSTKPFTFNAVLVENSSQKEVHSIFQFPLVKIKIHFLTHTRPGRSYELNLKIGKSLFLFQKTLGMGKKIIISILSIIVY